MKDNKHINLFKAVSNILGQYLPDNIQSEYYQVDEYKQNSMILHNFCIKCFDQNKVNKNHNHIKIDTNNFGNIKYNLMIGLTTPHKLPQCFKCDISIDVDLWYIYNSEEHIFVMEELIEDKKKLSDINEHTIRCIQKIYEDYNNIYIHSSFPLWELEEVLVKFGRKLQIEYAIKN